MSNEPNTELKLRTICSHQTNFLNSQITLFANDDELCVGGAPRSYVIDGLPGLPLTLVFHEGDPAKVGARGLTHEILLAILIDRLETFQKGPYASTYNEETLTHLKAAIMAQEARAMERRERGVEGKLIP